MTDSTSFAGETMPPTPPTPSIEDRLFKMQEREANRRAKADELRDHRDEQMVTALRELTTNVRDLSNKIPSLRQQYVVIGALFVLVLFLLALLAQVIGVDPRVSAEAINTIVSPAH